MRAVTKIVHRVECDRVLRPHVVYDAAKGGYRAQVRCACRAKGRISTAVHLRFVDARRQSHAMPIAAPRVHAVRRIVVPTSVQVDAAWVGYWRSLCMRYGHKSRL